MCEREMNENKNTMYHTQKKLHIYSIDGKQLLKQYIKYYQTGGRKRINRRQMKFEFAHRDRNPSKFIKHQGQRCMVNPKFKK